MNGYNWNVCCECGIEGLSEGDSYCERCLAQYIYPHDILNFCPECGIDGVEDHGMLCEDCLAQYTMSDPSAKVDS